MSLGLQFIQSLLSTNNASPLRDVREEFFVKSELPVYRFVRKHFERHKVLPDRETLLENGHRLMRATEPASYYSGKLRERYIYLLISDRNADLVRAMKNKNPADAMLIIRELASLGAHVLEQDSFSTLQLEAQDLLADYNRIKETGIPDMGIPFPWATFNAATLGMQGGDLIVLAGRPNVGKSWIMLAMAVYAWLQGYSIGILSMEMTRKQMVRRFMGLATGANPNNIRKGTLSTWAEELMRGMVRGLRRRPPVYINSPDLKHKSTALVEKLCAEHSPDIIFIDAAYRLVPVEVRSNMVGHERHSALVGELKALATHFDRPIVAVNQYNRTVKSNAKSAAELGTAGGTDSWEQDSSIFIGVRKGPAPFEDSSRVLDLTKDREGPLGAVRCNFGFEPVDFSEVTGDEQFSTEESEWQE